MPAQVIDYSIIDYSIEHAKHVIADNPVWRLAYFIELIFSCCQFALSEPLQSEAAVIL
jgi:hypothetical protein